MKLVAKTAVLLSLFFYIVPLLAQPVSQLRPTGYVNDFARVLDADTTDQLNDIAQQIDQKAHAQIAVVTVLNLSGFDIESYAVDLFKEWGIGSKSTNRGVLILVATEDRRYRIEVGYGLEPILPDGKVGSFGREAVPLLRQSDYNAALSLMTVRVAQVIAQDAGIQLTGAQPRVPAARTETPRSGISPIAILVLLIIILFVPPLRRLLFWMLIFGAFSGGRRSWGGGGFGSGSWGGGGGFGGFGGGMSGGGGASGSW